MGIGVGEYDHDFDDVKPLKMKDYEKMWKELKESVDTMNKDKIKEHDAHNHHSEPTHGMVLYFESEAYEKVLEKINQIENQI